MLCVSYPAGNTSRHMGQLCSPPLPAASPSPLTLLCTASSSLSPSTSSLFLHFSCGETRLPNAAAADDDGPVWMWREGCGLLLRSWTKGAFPLWLCLLWEQSCPSDVALSSSVRVERACLEELSLTGSGLDEGGASSGKGATSSPRSPHRWSSGVSALAL